MKTAYMTYVCNGFTLMASADTLRPPPVWVFAASVAEAIYYLEQYFAGAPDDSPLPSEYVPGPIDRAAKAADPLMNQEAVIWPAHPAGFMVRQSQHRAFPDRPVLEEYCPNMDAVHTALDAIFTPPV